MKSYVIVNNDVMQKLSDFSTPLIFNVYVYLKAYSVNGCLCRTYKRISDDLQISPQSAQKAVKELCKARLIMKKNRFGCRGYKSNMYVFPEEKRGSYTRIPRELLCKGLSASEFLTLCYILYKTGAKDSAYPSYNKMAKDTGLARRTLILAVQSLEKNGILSIIKRFYISCKTRLITKARKSNRYKRALLKTRFLATAVEPVKGYKQPWFSFLKAGWCKIWQTVVKCTNIVYKKKKRLSLFKVFHNLCI